MITPRLVRPAIKYSFAAAALLVILAYLLGCGVDSRQRVLRATLTSVNAARAAFVTWDDQAQSAIVVAAVSLVEGQAKLEVHRAKRDRVLIAFEAAYRTLALASASESSQLDEVISAASALWDVYRTVVGASPPAALELPADAGGS